MDPMSSGDDWRCRWMADIKSGRTPLLPPPGSGGLVLY